jgi:sporulation protein YlmC with PRC-barrel domain
MENLEIDNQTGENHSGLHPNTPVRLLTASTMINDRVYNVAGDDLGKIKDVMINLETEKIQYVVIEFGGFLGLGEKLFAFPLSDFAVDTERHAFTLNKSKEELENEPGFDKDHWPETNAHYASSGGGSWGGFMGSNVGSEY